jgi:hypothetical protein
VEKCGGVVANHIKMLQVASLIGINKQMMRKN